MQACAKYPKYQICSISAISQKTKEREEVDSLHTDKHQTILQVDTIDRGVHGRPAQITQNTNFAKSLQYLKKKVRDEVDFLCR